MARQLKTQIKDPELISLVCQIQNRFVKDWNKAEINGDALQSHELPGGALYSAAEPARGASFVLPDGAWLQIHAKAPWCHWHDGWSFCRHELSPKYVRKLVLHGPQQALDSWLASVMTVKAESEL